MSTASFPNFPGLTWPIKRMPIWQTRAQASVSGKILNIADWSYPKWRWTLRFSALRGYTTALADAEINAMYGFYNARQGKFDSFLFSDTADRSATGSTLGTGDSTDRTWQLVRSLGGFSEPILAPVAVSAVYVGGSSQSSTRWSVANWGSTAPGIVTFSTFAPTTGQAITADFTYAWPVSFDDDILTFEQFVKKIWGLDGVSMTSLK